MSTTNHEPTHAAHPTAANAQAPPSAPAGTRHFGGAAALWASAFVLLGLIVHSAATRPGSQAHAADANTTGGRLAIATALSSGGEDMIVVVDNTAEKLLMYTITAGRGLELKQSRNIEDLFPDVDR